VANERTEGIERPPKNIEIEEELQEEEEQVQERSFFC